MIWSIEKEPGDMEDRFSMVDCREVFQTISFQESVGAW